MTETETLAWLAGLLEGEGFFGIIKSHNNGRIYRYPQIVIQMTDEDVVQRVADVFGTKLYRNKKVYGTGSKLLCFKAVCSGQRAATWMAKLRPMMGVRRKLKIDACLTEWSSRPSANTMRSLTLKATIARQKQEDLNSEA